MPLQLIRHDLTKMKVDAIVNAANTSLLGGGGVDGAIHHAAGPELLAETRTLGGCRVGQAKITKGYNLPAKYVIHTVGPVWQGGKSDEENLLRDCYLNSLQLAREHNLRSIAFPLISTGVFGYPKDQALQIAHSAIEVFLLENEMMVYLVSFDRESFELSEKLFISIKTYIDDQYVEVHSKKVRRPLAEAYLQEDRLEVPKRLYQREYKSEIIEYKELIFERKVLTVNLDELVNKVGKTFSQSLLHLIDKKNLSDVETYKKANISRKLFSKIRTNVDYQPSKKTAISFAIALKLSFDDTQELLAKAGYALSKSSKFDIIIQYFILKRKYDIFEINAALFKFDQRLLGQ